MDLTNKQKEEIKALYFKNTRITDIADTTGINLKIIQNFLKQEKINKARRAFWRHTIESGLEQKKLASEVAEELHCTTRQLCKIAENLKIKIYFTQIAKERREKLIVEEFKRNPATIKKMAEKLNFSFCYIQKIYKKNGLVKEKENHFKVLNLQSYKEILEEIKQGELTLTQIGKKHGISKQRVSIIKKKLQSSD